MIAFSCSGCGKAFAVPDHLAGRKSTCKACGARLEIPAFGLDLAPPPDPRPTREETPRRQRPKRRQRGTIDRDGWVSLGIGTALAALAVAVGPIGFVVHILVTVIHELGHVAAAWLFASPAVPSFDLTYGGGVSLIFPRQPLLVAAGCGLFLFALIRARGDRADLIRWSVAAAFYLAALLTPLRDLLILGMGHGAELLIAGVFLHRALSGNQILRGEERPLYAALGLFIVVDDARFALGLMTSQADRDAYGDAKGGGHAMDFDRIAAELGWTLPTVAGLFLLACIATPVAAYLAYRRRPR